jgi:hypothetical protein
VRFEILTSIGRGAHLANPGQHRALCMRPVLQRTGREGSIKTPYLCQGARPGSPGAGGGGEMRATLSAPAYRLVGCAALAGLLLQVAFDLVRSS